VDAPSADGFAPLHLAAFFGKPEAATLLLARGAQVDARGRGWMTGTPLHSAVSNRHVDLVEILLAAGADPNARQSGGWTPLHGASHNGDVASVALLLTAGADPAAVNDDGASVLSLAEEQGDAATIDAVRLALDQAP
jgi:ankyrin repeat protein